MGSRRHHDPEVRKKADAQSEYCKKHDLPHFAPRNGHCFLCKKQIYDRIRYETAANELITGCPWCHYSYCG